MENVKIKQFDDDNISINQDKKVENSLNDKLFEYVHKNPDNNDLYDGMLMDLQDEDFKLKLTSR